MIAVGAYSPLMPEERGSDDSPKPIDPIRVGFGMRLAAARGLKPTQQEVADRLGVTKGTVSAWEKGRGLPDALRLRQLAKLYGVSADSLLWEDSLSPEAMQFAADFDHLTEAQRRTFKAVWTAFIAQAIQDTDVEDRMEITKTLKERADQLNRSEE